MSQCILKHGFGFSIVLLRSSCCGTGANTQRVPLTRHQRRASAGIELVWSVQKHQHVRYNLALEKNEIALKIRVQCHIENDRKRSMSSQCVDVSYVRASRRGRRRTVSCSRKSANVRASLRLRRLAMKPTRQVPTRPLRPHVWSRGGGQSHS